VGLGDVTVVRIIIRMDVSVDKRELWSGEGGGEEERELC
jgi:hypothetical protein